MNINKEILASGDISKIVKYLVDNNIEEKEIATAMDYKSKGRKSNKANAVYQIRKGKSQPAWEKAYKFIQYLYTIDPDFSADDIFKGAPNKDLEEPAIENKAANVSGDVKTQEPPADLPEVKSLKIEPQKQIVSSGTTGTEIAVLELLRNGNEQEYLKCKDFLAKNEIEIDEFIEKEGDKLLAHEFFQKQLFGRPEYEQKKIRELFFRIIKNTLILKIIAPNNQGKILSGQDILQLNKLGIIFESKRLPKDLISLQANMKSKFRKKYECIYAPERFIKPEPVAPEYVKTSLID